MMMKFIHFIFLLSITLHVVARATDSSESKSAGSSRSSSSEEMRYNEDLEDLVNAAGNNSTAEEVKDTETAHKTEGKSGGLKEDEKLEKLEKPSGKTNIEKVDEALESDKKESVQKRAKVDSLPSNSTENLTDDDMKMMDQFNKTMESGEDMQKNNETVLGIDTFGAQGI